MAITFVRPALIQFSQVASGSTKFSLSDHNRSEFQVSPERIANDVRSWNGNLRRNWFADRLVFSWSYEDLPNAAAETVDGFWGADDLISWWRDHPEEFVITLKDINGASVEYYGLITDFSYVLTKRWEQFFYYNIDIEVSVTRTDADGGLDLSP